MDYKKEIKSVGLSISKIAEKMGVSYGMMSHYINGRAEMENYLQNRFKKIIATYKRAEMSL